MVSMAAPSRLIVGISGASGVIWVRLLQGLKKIPVESHLVMTRTAEVTWRRKSRMLVAEVRRSADATYRVDNKPESLNDIIDTRSAASSTCSTSTPVRSRAGATQRRGRSRPL
jgi:4-hydroxy-3-polyprenylbenzoate decarboxylase